MAPSISRVSLTFFASARQIYMQFTGFSKAFMTSKRPADGSSLGFGVNVTETATHCQNRPGVFAAERRPVPSTIAFFSGVCPIRAKARTGRIKCRSSNGGQSAEGIWPPASIAGFQNAATLL